MRATALCGVAVASLPGAVTGAGAAPGPVVHPLGTDVVIRPSGHIGKGAGTHPGGSFSHSFALPTGARQGPRRWYVMDLRARVRIRRREQPSLIYLTGSTNGRASVQVKIKVPPGAHATAPVRWESYGLIDGLVVRRASSSVIAIDARNFLQYRGVRPGRNSFDVGLEEFGGHALRDVTVGRATRISGGHVPPADVRVKTSAAAVRRDGGTLVVPVTVVNSGGRAARHVEVLADTDPAALAPTTTGPQRVGALGPGASRTVTLRFDVVRDGATSVEVDEHDDVGSAHASIRLDPAAAPPTGGARSALGIAVPGALFATSACLVLLPRRRRRARR